MPVPTLAQFRAAAWNLIVIFLSIVVAYELRNHIVVGCLAGIVSCLLGLSVIGLVERHRRRKGAPAEHPSEITVPEGATLTTALGSSGSSFLLHIAAASVAPIVENFQAVTGRGGFSSAQDRLTLSDKAHASTSNLGPTAHDELHLRDEAHGPQG